MSKKVIFQHFRASEKVFIEKVLNTFQRVENTYSPILTEFLDPRQVEIYKNLARYQGLSLYSSNDYVTSEYARLIIAPDYYVLDLADFNIVLVELDYARKFNSISHSQVLGTLIHQLGIKRSVFGDVLLEGKSIQLFLDQKMFSYFQQEVTRIGKTSVRLIEKSFSEKINPQYEYIKQEILVSSFRLDKVLASVLKLSRTQVNKLILSNKVKLNYQLVNKISETLEIGDMLSVRGFGRFILVADNGLTKNGKNKLSIEKIGKL